MGRIGPLRPEILLGLDNPPPEIAHPDPVDRYPRCQRMARIDQPLRQVEPRRKGFTGGCSWQGRRNRGDHSGSQQPRRLVRAREITTRKDVGLTRRRHFAHHHRRDRAARLFLTHRLGRSECLCHQLALGYTALGGRPPQRRQQRSSSRIVGNR